MLLRLLLSELRLYICNFIVSNVPFHSLRDWYYRQAMGFNLHPSSSILMDVRFGNARGFEIASNSVLNEGCRVRNAGGVQIGSNVSISPWVKLLTADHQPQSRTFAGRARPIVIQDYVFIGAGATILGGVIIAEGAVVASGAVVTRNVDAYTIVAGVPAKPIGQRIKDLHYDLDYKRFLH